jgi:hypothetical protein
MIFNEIETYKSILEKSAFARIGLDMRRERLIKKENGHRG